MSSPVPPTPYRPPRQLAIPPWQTVSGSWVPLSPQQPTTGTVSFAGGPSTMPPPPQGQYTTPGASVTSIQPGQDLRGTQISYAPDPRLTQTQGMVNTAAQQVGGFQGFTPYSGVNLAGSPYVGQAGRYLGQAAEAAGGANIGGVALPSTASYGTIQAGTYAPAADVTQTRGGILDLLAQMQTSPDRQALATRAFQNLQTATEPRYQADLRAVAQQAAAMGRQGSGLTTSDLGTVAQRRNQALAQAQEDLAVQTAGQELADQAARLQAGQGVYGQLSGQDIATAGVQQGLRQEQRGERGWRAGQDLAAAQLQAQQQQAAANLALSKAGLFAGLGGQAFGMGEAVTGREIAEQNRRLGYEQAGLGAQQGILGQLAALEAQQYGIGQAGRQELRGERSYQDYLNQQAMQNRQQQALLEEQLLNSAYGRYGNEYGMLEGAGGQYDPTGLAMEQAAGYQQQANQAFGGVGDLLAYYQMLQAQRRGPGAGPAEIPFGYGTMPGGGYNVTGPTYG